MAMDGSKVTDFGIDRILGPEVGQSSRTPPTACRGLTFFPEGLFYGTSFNQNRPALGGPVLVRGCVPFKETSVGNGRIYAHRPSGFDHSDRMVLYPNSHTHTGVHQPRVECLVHLPAPHWTRGRLGVRFTCGQTRQLEALFGLTQHPDPEARAELARRAGLSEETVRVWFKNRRARQKRQCKRSKAKFPSPSKEMERGAHQSSSTENLLTSFL